MKGRCNNQKSSDYPDYGGRGIKVCERWEKFENFLADMGKCPPTKFIDRIDNDGNYEPGNCRWATAVEQANNKRWTLRVTFNGETLPVARLAARFGISSDVLYERVARYGWSVEDAVNTPVVPRTPNLVFSYKGKLHTLSELAKIARVGKGTLDARLRFGKWTVEDAVETPKCRRPK